MKKFIIPILILFAALSCNKDESTVTNGSGETTINISLDTPNENDEFDFGSTISIQGSIVSNKTVHGYSVELINTSNQDSVLYLNEVHSHDSSLEFDDTWTHELTDTSQVLIRIIAYTDHEGNQSETMTRMIVCNGQ